MKKKGLILATVVMVVVLVASLTTATYAWFNISQTTSIDGFNVSVEAGNIMNIGLNAQGYTSYKPDASPDNFVSGQCEYVGGDAGQFKNGYWTGSAGLGAAVSHNIAWSLQSKAVGFTTATTAAGATYDNTKFMGNAEGTEAETWKRVVIANGTKTTMATAKDAVANKRDTTDAELNTANGDFVYMFLGAQPTNKITNGTNKLHIVIQPQGIGNTNGMAAAIHVAYKVNDQANWKDVDAFGSKHYNNARTDNSATINGQIATTGFTENSITYNEQTKVSTVAGAVSVDIDLSDWDGTGTAPLDQIQLVIYIAGYDTDCIDAAKNGQIKIGIFFGAQEAE